MTRPIAFALALSLLAWPAAAQTTDTDRILEAIKSLNDKVDSLQAEVEALQAQMAPPEPSDAAAADPAPASPPAPSAEVPPRSVAGWMVDVMPYSEDGNASRLFRFNAPSVVTSFAAHKAVRPITDNVWHRGTAKLNIYTPGQYGFSIELDNRLGYTSSNCFADMSIGDQKVFAGEIKYARSGEIYPFNGQIDLQQGNYDIQYEVGCKKPYRTAMFQKDSYSVFVLGPNDDEPRFFKPNELFTLRAQ